MDIEFLSSKVVPLQGSMTPSYTQSTMSANGSVALDEQLELVDVRVNAPFSLSLAFAFRLNVLPFHGEVAKLEKVLSLSLQRHAKKSLRKKKSVKKKSKKVVDPSTFNWHESLLPYTQALSHEGDDNTTTLNIVVVQEAL